MSFFVTEGEDDTTLEEVLVFITGADTIPPLGFKQEEKSRRLPYSSTCSLAFFLPRGVNRKEEFKDLMHLAINASLVFGRA